MGLVTDSPGYSCSASKKSHIWSKWTPHRKKCFISGISQITSPPNSGKLYNFFGCQKRRFSTYYKTNDYDNDGSDNCDYNFGTFDNFGVKNDQKVSHNMILMSRYMGQLHSGRGPKNSGKAPPSPSSGNARKKTCSLSQRESSCKNLFELFLVPLPPN